MTWSLLWEGKVEDVSGFTVSVADGELPEDASYGGSDDDHPVAVAAFGGAIAMARAAGFNRARISASGHVPTDPMPHGEQSVRVTGLVDEMFVGEPELGGAGEHEGDVGPEQAIGVAHAHDPDNPVEAVEVPPDKSADEVVPSG